MHFCETVLVMFGSQWSRKDQVYRVYRLLLSCQVHENVCSLAVIWGVKEINVRMVGCQTPIKSSSCLLSNIIIEYYFNVF